MNIKNIFLFFALFLAINSTQIFGASTESESQPAAEEELKSKSAIEKKKYPLDQSKEKVYLFTPFEDTPKDTPVPYNNLYWETINFDETKMYKIDKDPQLGQRAEVLPGHENEFRDFFGVDAKRPIKDWKLYPPPETKVEIPIRSEFIEYKKVRPLAPGQQRGTAISKKNF